MKNRILMGLATVAMVAFLVSCGKVPQAEIDATNAAIAAAQAAEANVYLPAEFKALQDSMAAINTAVTAQEGKLFKKFAPVKEDLASTLALANQVAANAAVKKEEVKKEAEGILTSIKTVIAENLKLIPKLPKGKEGNEVIAQIKADMGTVDATVADAQASFDKGAFMDALNKVKAANDQAGKLNAEVKEVLTKARIRF